MYLYFVTIYKKKWRKIYINGNNIILLKYALWVPTFTIILIYAGFIGLNSIR